MKYRKKPVVVDAFQYCDDFMKVGANCNGVPDWGIAAYDDGILYFDKNDSLSVKTLEGDVTASVGDYIIRGANGELYPCKPDIFLKTYENVTEEPKIRIESDGKTVKLFANGERVKCRLVDFHAEGTEDGNHIKWEYETIKYRKDGVALVEDGALITEKRYFDNM